jgi:hypothetical protein
LNCLAALGSWLAVASAHPMSALVSSELVALLDRTRRLLPNSGLKSTTRSLLGSQAGLGSLVVCCTLGLSFRALGLSLSALDLRCGALGAVGLDLEVLGVLAVGALNRSLESQRVAEEQVKDGNVRDGVIPDESGKTLDDDPPETRKVVLEDLDGAAVIVSGNAGAKLAFGCLEQMIDVKFHAKTFGNGKDSKSGTHLDVCGHARCDLGGGASNVVEIVHEMQDTRPCCCLWGG